MSTRQLDANRLRNILDYNGETGEFTWARGVKSCKVKPGQKAGHVDDTGYLKIGIEGRLYKAHRLAWLHVHGEWPTDCLVHINGEALDNRLCNLREASRSDSHKNRKEQREPWSLGASWHKRSQRWQARIKIDGKQFYLGYFEDMAGAHAAYNAAKANIHKLQPAVRQ